jgi:hypothetical protein
MQTSKRSAIHIYVLVSPSSRDLYSCSDQLCQLMGPKMMWILQHIAFSLYGIIRIFAVLSNLQMLASTKRPLLLLPLKDEFVALVTKLFSELYN